jgi:hypothetical protein
VALLISELRAKHAGEVLCGELLRRGLEPTAMEVVSGGSDVLIALTILKEWTKGFLVDAKRLDPEVVETMLENWKAKVRDDLAQGHPTPPVLKAIQRYGRHAVDLALMPKRTVQ